MRYKSLVELIEMIDRPMKTKVFDIYHKYRHEFSTAQGSQHNHQAWEGGYVDHVTDMMNIARLLYQAMNDKRKLPFTLSDALGVIFFHDIEKAFPARIDALARPSGDYFTRPKAKSKIRYKVIHEERAWELFNDEQKNALDHAEGEGNGYTNERRTMCPLAAFVNMCDVASARIWFDRPLGDGEPWGWRESHSLGEEQLWGV